MRRNEIFLLYFLSHIGGLMGVAVGGGWGGVYIDMFTKFSSLNQFIPKILISPKRPKYECNYRFLKNLISNFRKSGIPV